MTTATEAASREVIGACPHDCPDTCSMVTTVRDGVAIKVHGNPAHPQTGGALCAKVARYPERTYHPDRVLQPMRRTGPKGAGQFEPVSWDVALDDIAARLGDLAARGLQQAVLPYSYAGTMGYVQGEAMAMRFFNRLGASQLERTVCSTAGGQGLVYTLGGKVGMRVENFVDARLILIWGSNSIGSNLHFWRYAQEAKRRGARLVCIDPRRTETADKCHEHIALLPGTDAALALALMQQLIIHDWLDHDYLQAHTLGWDALRARALEWPPERAAAVCGIEAAQITALARAYGETARAGQPVAIRLNYGMQRVRGAANAVRAVCCLPALVGAWRHAAGGLLLSSSGVHSSNDALLERPDLSPNSHERLINMNTIGDDLLRPASPEFGPRIDAIVVYNCNPLAIAPDSSKVAQGFAREDLFTVVLEHFQTDTADYADYLLPATTQLEHWDIHNSYGHTDVLLNRPSIAPLGQAKTNTEIFRLLAARRRFTTAPWKSRAPTRKNLRCARRRSEALPEFQHPGRNPGFHQKTHQRGKKANHPGQKAGKRQAQSLVIQRFAQKQHDDGQANADRAQCQQSNAAIGQQPPGAQIHQLAPVRRSLLAIALGLQPSLD